MGRYIAIEGSSVVSDVGVMVVAGHDLSIAGGDVHIVATGAGGIATVVILSGVGLASGFIFAAIYALSSGNNWLRTHRAEVFFESVTSFCPVAILVCCAFALGARMPLWRFQVSSPDR